MEETDFYLSDKYMEINPEIHERDVPWKLKKMIPFIDNAIKHLSNTNKISLLDVGGGSGLILREISNHLEGRGISIVKYILDLSPGMLTVQMKNNPDFKIALNENTCKTSLNDKEIDIAMMIDVLEHVDDVSACLKEIKRISRFVILKVPLEHNVYFNILNLLTKGEKLYDLRKKIGHINIFDEYSIKKKIEKETGELLEFEFTNVFEYFRASKYYQSRGRKEILIDYLGSQIFKISPRFCAFLLPDYAICLIRCKD